jgi:coenzyme F420 hydrogenase subunit beta
MTNEFADISFGDAWIKNYKKDDNIGRSVIISRNNKGNNLLKKSYNDNIININEEDVKDIIKGFGNIIISKKDFSSYSKCLTLFNEKTPDYKNLKSINLNRKIIVLIEIFSTRFASKVWTWPFLKYFTFPIYIFRNFLNKKVIKDEIFK